MKEQYKIISGDSAADLVILQPGAQNLSIVRKNAVAVGIAEYVINVFEVGEIRLYCRVLLLPCIIQ